MAHSSKRAAARKPYPTFPLTPRADGRWCKKIRGQVVIFTGSADEALAEYRRVADDLENGRVPRPKVEGLLVKEVAGRFLVAKDEAVATGELAPKTRIDYQRMTDCIVAHFGEYRVVADLRPEDFGMLRAKFATGELQIKAAKLREKREKRHGLKRNKHERKQNYRPAKKNGLVAIANFVQRVRVLFKWAYDAELIPVPVRFGPGFKRPTKKAMRIAKADAPKKLFSAAEVRALIDNAPLQMRAMVLLAINAAMGNHDCATLKRRHLDLQNGWLTMPRPKTGTMRRAKLWPETVEAINAVLKVRKQPKQAAHADLVFVTRCRESWASIDTYDSPVAKEFAKLVRKQKLVQLGRGFYCLRHTWRTEADGVKDLEAIRTVMGHTSGHVEAEYVERLPDDSRLQAVADHVRVWLFGNSQAKGKPKAKHRRLRIIG